MELSTRLPEQSRYRASTYAAPVLEDLRHAATWKPQCERSDVARTRVPTLLTGIRSWKACEQVVGLVKAPSGLPIDWNKLYQTLFTLDPI